MSDDVRWLTDDELAAWMPFSGMLLKLHSALDAELQGRAGLTLFTYLVLAALSDVPCRTRRMTDLALLTNGSLSRLSHAVAKLERRGLVRRNRCPEDGRVTLVTLTDEGYAEVVRAAPAHVESVRRLVVDLLTPAQLRQLRDVSRVLLGPDAEHLRPPKRRP